MDIDELKSAAMRGANEIVLRDAEHHIEEALRCNYFREIGHRANAFESAWVALTLLAMRKGRI
jgi:hypothetical protein